MTLRVAVSLQQLSYLFYLVHHCGIEHFRTFLAMSITADFTKLGEMTDADKTMNPQHFGSDPVL